MLAGASYCSVTPMCRSAPFSTITMVGALLWQALSANGRCKTFDDSADGYGRGEALVVACLVPTQSYKDSVAILQVRPD